MPKSFMHNEIFIPALFLFVSMILILAGCSKSDDQKEFENEAFNIPNDITQTDASGEIIEDNKDNDDWRISPRYSGLITIGELFALPHPNPVPYNQNLTLEIDLKSIQNLSEIEVYVLDLDAPNPLVLIDQREITSTPTLITFTLSGQLISGSAGGSDAEDLYRILIYDDGSRNMISYGDVKID